MEVINVYILKTQFNLTVRGKGKNGLVAVFTFAIL